MVRFPRNFLSLCDKEIVLKNRSFYDRYQLSHSEWKLPAYRAGLPEEEVSFILCPLTPPTRRGRARHVSVK